MSDNGKTRFNELFSDDIQGPFVTFVLNTHVAHQDISKDILAFKNLGKSAKSRFEKRFAEHDWAPIQEKIDALEADAAFWRNTTKSITIIFTKDETYIYKLNVPVDNQYYVGKKPYLLGIIKDNQFTYNYYLLALNRDSMSLYLVNNQIVTPVELPEDAPTDLVGTLGDELTGGNLNYSTKAGTGYNGSGKEGVAYHGINPKDEEVEIDWINYYQAIDNYLKDSFDNPENLPIFLYALPENQATFKKIAKNPYLDTSASVPSSPAQVTIKEISAGAEKINQHLEELETENYNELMDKKFVDQLVDIVPAAKEGRLSHFFIATANFINETNEMSSEEFDRRKLLNNTAYAVIKTGGNVFVLEQHAAPDEKSLLGILRY
ncbi:baeRF6 domain-containing protein [Enterococcus sp. LJL128]|uniref:baeRF6 domain-containing protein n=1 Tax=Enterococcus sp. LJL51 TaxID=3416656 RepID=UPI003CEF57E0